MAEKDLIAQACLHHLEYLYFKKKLGDLLHDNSIKHDTENQEAKETEM